MVSTRYTFENSDAWLSAQKLVFDEGVIKQFERALKIAETYYAKLNYDSVEIPLISYALTCAAKVAALNLYEDAVIATLLFYLPDILPNWRDELAGFDAQVITLIEGMELVMHSSELESVDITHADDDEHQEQMEIIRDMLLAMARDIRILLIVLVCRSQLMLNLKKCKNFAKQQKIAYATLEVFAPLANRLGMWQVKWELEDLAFKFLHPEAYKELVELLDETREERLYYMKSIYKIFTELLDKNGISGFEIMGRAKHIYSIWRKMQKKKYNFEDLYDIRALRILVQDIEDCYTVLGIVHTEYTPILDAFDDYIAHPKPNNYQSLHTCIIGPSDKIVEIQIRTYDMHDYAEHGIAAHWRYKESHGSTVESKEGLLEKLAGIRQMLNLRDEVEDEPDATEIFKNEIFNDTIYVLTPKGKVVSLPKGATVIDFAYTIHSEVGHRCRGAKINGHIVPLSTVLKNGQEVEVLTIKNGAPSINWLYEGVAKTTKAITHIRKYIRSQNLEEFYLSGSEILERELGKFPAGLRPTLEQIQVSLGYDNEKNICVDLGRGEISLSAVRFAIENIVHKKPKHEPLTPENIVLTHKAKISRRDTKEITIGGVTGIVHFIAKCCKPLPGDSIIGFVTQGRGVAIHRNSCVDLKRQAKASIGRIVKVEWGTHVKEAIFQTDLIVVANDRPELLREINDLFAIQKLSIVGLKTTYKAGKVKFIFSIQLSGVILNFPDLINKLFTIDGILNVARR